MELCCCCGDDSPGLPDWKLFPGSMVMLLLVLLFLPCQGQAAFEPHLFTQEVEQDLDGRAGTGAVSGIFHARV